MVDFRHPLRNAIARYSPAAIGISIVRIKMEIPAKSPQETVVFTLISFSLVLSAMVQAASVNAANGMSDMRFAEKKSTRGFTAQTAVKTNATLQLVPHSFRRKKNAETR